MRAKAKVNVVFGYLIVAYINNIKLYLGLYVFLLESIYILVGVVIIDCSELTRR